MVSVNQKSTGTLRTRREILRRRRRERQVIVFGVAAIALGAVGFASYSVYSGEAEGPFSAPFVTPAGDFFSDIKLPCPPPDTLPMNVGEVPYRVLNATDRAGLAGEVSKTLEGRGFVPVGVGNSSRKYDGHVRISFGPEGLVQAYTLANQFSNYELVLDNRTNTTVDVLIGEAFSDVTGIRPLLAPELQPDILLTENAPCLPLRLVEPEPAPRIVPDDPFTIEPSPTPSPGDADVAAEDSITD